ncbi:MAG: hypothetical protein K0U16_07370 [Gammaproteobacteria bacterium]|nr:hypothetical protein [Gammaproteobacteria bacterium]
MRWDPYAALITAGFVVVILFPQCPAPDDYIREAPPAQEPELEGLEPLFDECIIRSQTCELDLEACEERVVEANWNTHVEHVRRVSERLECEQQAVKE